MMKAEFKKTRADLKICVVGDSGTGKTSFCKRWIHGTFGDIYKATVLVDFQYKLFEHKGYFYKIQIWDIAGQDKNVSTTNVFTKNSHGTFYLCDITKPETLDQTLKWKKSIDDSTKFIDGNELPSYIIQNKCDLIKNSKELDESDKKLKHFCSSNKFSGCMQVSCKTGKNVEESMNSFISGIIDRLEDYYKATGKDISAVTQNRVLKSNDLYTQKQTEEACC